MNIDEIMKIIINNAQLSLSQFNEIRRELVKLEVKEILENIYKDESDD